MATVMLPPSSTLWPSASSRASKPATRTADGPMSTPRRDCPRSSGTPITRMFFFVPVAGCRRSVARFFCAVGSISGLFVALSILRIVLRINLVEHARERDGLAHVLERADPGHSALDAHAEATVRHAAELAQVQIPLEGFFWKPVLVDALAQRFIRVHALRAADDLAVAL